MPAYVRGYVVCDGCKKSANSSAYIGEAFGKTSFRWALPEGWSLYESRGHGNVATFCSPGCNKYLATCGSPSQRGHVPADDAFDERTLDKLMDLIDVGANRNASADNVLAALEVVLTAWRKRAVPA